MSSARATELDETKSKTPCSIRSSAESCMTSVYIIMFLSPLFARPLSTALPTEPTPDWMGPMLSGNLPAATSPSRNFTTFSPIFAVVALMGLKLCG